MRAPVLAAVTVLPLLLLLALTEGVVVGPEPPTYAPGECPSYICLPKRLS